MATQTRLNKEQRNGTTESDNPDHLLLIFDLLFVKAPIYFPKNCFYKIHFCKFFNCAFKESRIKILLSAETYRISVAKKKNRKKKH